MSSLLIQRPAGRCSDWAARIWHAERASWQRSLQDEQAELARLPQEISEADPTAKATNLDNAATRVDELVSNIVGASTDV